MIDGWLMEKGERSERNVRKEWPWLEFRGETIGGDGKLTSELLAEFWAAAFQWMVDRHKQGTGKKARGG